MNRILDIGISLAVLLLTAPLLAAVAIAVRASSPGPVFYLADRVGMGGRLFQMYKFRSMHVNTRGPHITAKNDNRVFAVGRIIRALKLDELPQFLNVIYGDMAIVGPRPEAPSIVADHYIPWMRETLKVRPGVTSPGAIFYYAYGEKLLDNEEPDRIYVEKILASKLALDLAYLKRENVISNLIVMAHTAIAILAKTIGRPIGPQSVDIEASKQWCSHDAFFELRPKNRTAT
jgi:lipopolysaccharide/colanic/teichoic acid biosynthesis glycosyltransferase